jgi:ribosomal protein S7
MPRKGAVPKRQILPDPRFNSKVLSRFINKVMLAGKKSVAEGITYGALGIVGEKLGRDPMDVFTQALGNAMPLVEVRPRRVGGATYQVPMEVRPDRRQAMALADPVRAQAPRPFDGREARQRDHGRREQRRGDGQEARGYAQDGGGEQSVRPLPLVTRS